MNDSFSINDMIAQAFAMLRSVWRNRWWGLAASWFVCVAGWLYFANLPDAYESKARIYVAQGEVLGGFLKDLTVQDNIHAKVALILRTMHSRQNLIRLMEMTGTDIAGYTNLEIERLIEHLKRTIRITQVGDNLFMIAFQAGDPQRAHDVVQALLKIFIDSNIGASRSEMDKAELFIEQQITDYQQQLETADLRLARFRQANMDYLSTQTGYPVRVEQARGNLDELRARLRDARVRHATLQKELASVPPFFRQESSQSAGGIPGPVQRVRQLEAKLEDLISRFTDEHPDVVTARRLLAAAYQQLEQEPEQDETSSRRTVLQSANPVYEQLKVQLVNQEAEIATLLQRVSEAEAKVAELRTSASQAPSVEAEFIKLKREYDRLKIKYESFLGQRESYRISRAQQTSAQESQFRIVEPPQVAAQSIWPNRFAYFTLALVLGLGAGGAFAFVLGLSSDTVSEIPELRKAIALPVLGGVSLIKSQSQRLSQIAEGMVFGVVVLGLFASYGVFIFVEYTVGFGSINLTDPSNLVQSAFQVFV